MYLIVILMMKVLYLKKNLFLIVTKDDVSSFKLLEVNPEKNNEKITNHYYLIDAVKNNDLNYIKSYFSDKYNNVNESSEYGYPGNTILHQAVFDGMNE